MELLVKLYALTAFFGLLGTLLVYKAVPFFTLFWNITATIVTNVSWIYLGSGLVLLAISAMFYDAHSKKPAKSFGLFHAVGVYVLLRGLRYFGAFSKWRLDIATRDLERTQRAVLKKILKHLSHTAYYADCRLDKVSTMEDFRAFHPVVKYDHYEPWIERIINGEDNVLTANKVDFLGATGGTTSGKSKLFPKSLNVKWMFMRAMLLFYGHEDEIPGSLDIKATFFMIFKTKVRYINGLKVAPLSAILTSDQRFNICPRAAQQIPDFHTSLYVQLLFALKEREVGVIVPGFASHAYALFKLAEDRWRDLCSDIRRGAINDDVSTAIPAYLLEQLRPQLRPDPLRADELEAEFEKGVHNFVPRVWPYCRWILGIFTGPFAIYKTVLQAKYVGDIKLVTYVHASTECVYGVNIWPGKRDVAHFVMVPNEAFVEFLEYDSDGNENAKCVLPHEVEIGKRYEMVVTTYDGLYRYRTNDVVEIVLFYNDAPVYIFFQRSDDNLSVFGEKTPVSELTAVLDEIASKWNVVEYSTTESIHIRNITGDGKELMAYVVMIEMTGDKPTPDDITQLDLDLRQRCEAYNIYREKGRIGPIELLHTAPGAFQRLREWIVNNNPDATFMQFKMPRLLRKEEHIRCLLRQETGKEKSA